LLTLGSGLSRCFCSGYAARLAIIARAAPATRARAPEITGDLNQPASQTFAYATLRFVERASPRDRDSEPFRPLLDFRRRPGSTGIPSWTRRSSAANSGSREQARGVRPRARLRPCFARHPRRRGAEPRAAAETCGIDRDKKSRAAAAGQLVIISGMCGPNGRPLSGPQSSRS